MQIDIVALLPYTLIPVLGLLGKLLIDRLTRIEKKAEDSISEAQTRQLLADKLEPLQEDIKEIKTSLNGLIENLYAKNRPSKLLSTRERDGE